MRTGGGKGQYLTPLVEALEHAGYSLARRSSSHFIFKGPERPCITVPQKLDSVHVAKKIAKVAGVAL
jgi:predicted RNA binding protein YcfA (HicA-like mRNA interferase family)